MFLIRNIVTSGLVGVHTMLECEWIGRQDDDERVKQVDVIDVEEEEEENMRMLINQQERGKRERQTF